MAFAPTATSGKMVGALSARLASFESPAEDVDKIANLVDSIRENGLTEELLRKFKDFKICKQKPRAVWPDIFVRISADMKVERKNMGKKQGGYNNDNNNKN